MRPPLTISLYKGAKPALFIPSNIKRVDDSIFDFRIVHIIRNFLFICQMLKPGSPCLIFHPSKKPLKNISSYMLLRNRLWPYNRGTTIVVNSGVPFGNINIIITHINRIIIMNKDIIDDIWFTRIS